MDIPSPEYKMQQHLTAAEEELAKGNLVEAENQVTRSSVLRNQVQDESILLKYRSLYAVVLDRNNRFAEAAARYYDLAVKSGYNEIEKLQALQNAITCTILAPPGVQRIRMLKTISKDDRCPQLVGFNILKNMHSERLISQQDLPSFEQILMANQKTVDKDGQSLLQKAVLQHNLLAVSRIYKCVTFDDVSELLGIPPDMVEKAVTKLISTDSLNGEVDQVERLITFKEHTKSPTLDWNSYIISVCEQTNKVNELISQKFPEWHAQRLQRI